MQQLRLQNIETPILFCQKVDRSRLKKSLISALLKYHKTQKLCLKFRQSNESKKKRVAISSQTVVAAALFVRPVSSR
jgi:hypothetical protein